VSEGQQVAVGQSLVRQDLSRIQAREWEAQAAVAGLEASLAERVAGPRQETIAAARANVQAAEVDLRLSELEFQRQSGLTERNLTSRENVDRARASVDSASARVEQARAKLAELEAGTRIEQVQQVREQLEQARARLTLIEIDRERLHSLAPQAGIVDSLPVEIGERPAAGSVIAVLLTGDQPHARVYVPEALRVNLQPGLGATVHVDGLDTPLQGTIRRIANEASFTPYFSLTEHDRGRLSYVAEITLPESPRRLPDGIPVQVEFANAGTP
ncbi:MAG: HlyD family efflux transporter periplasmic adaptor subunit, partial [Pseudohongiellaceae bacterium]